jgi:hypothetical protein
MPQLAWLEFNDGRWHLIADVRADPSPENRIWSNEDGALAELKEEGWIVSGCYPNELSDKLGLGDKFHGYGLMRTVY